jgi:anti-sigma B factor antagonist
MIEYETYQPGDNDEVLVIEVGGRLDTMSSEYLVDCVKTHTDRGARKIVLDCTNLDYVSSLGLAALIRSNSKMKEVGGSVALVQVPGLVADVVRIAHLDRLLNIYPTVEAALES